MTGLRARLRSSAVRGGSARGLHQRAEKGRGKGVASHSLGMPLHTDDPVFMRLMLDGFNHAIGSNRRDAQTVAQVADGLVMRRVDLDVESAVSCCEAGDGCELSDFAARLNPRGMDGIGCIRRKTFLAVLNAGVEFAGDVLVESATEANVEALATIANGEDRFSGSKGVLKNCEIGFFAVGVGVVRLFMARGAIKRGIHVSGGTGENEGIQIFDLGGEVAWRKLERQGDWLSLCGGDCGKVILELVRDPMCLFVRGAPGDTHTGAGGGA
jgi:hypothetical protein